MKERYHISGMTCSACSAHVEKAVNKLEGVEKASVNLLAETMEISYEEGRLGREEIEEAVEKAGYGASLIIGGARSGSGTSGGTAMVKICREAQAHGQKRGAIEAACSARPERRPGP